jgi:hypothetical protein
MRKGIILAALLAVLVAAPAIAELELGFGIAPPLGEVPPGAQSEGFLGDSTKVIHAGYSFLWLFYACYDGLILPPYAVSSMTGRFDISQGSYVSGYYRPGFLNTFTLGIRPRIGPIHLMAGIGINQLYVYKQEEDSLELPDIGVHLKLGAGFRFTNWLGVSVTGTTVFSDFDSLMSTLEALSGDDEYLQERAMDTILSNLFPSVALVIYM